MQQIHQHTASNVPKCTIKDSNVYIVTFHPEGGGDVHECWLDDVM